MAKVQKARTQKIPPIINKTPFASNQTIFTFRNLQFCCSAILKLACCSPFSFHQNNRFLVDLSPNTHCCFPFFHFPSLRLSLLLESLLLIFVLGITEFQNPKLSQSLHSVTLLFYQLFLLLYQ